MGMKKFSLDLYKGNYAMHCDTKEKAKIFCNYLHEKGRTWRSGRPYTFLKWFTYEDETVYCFNYGIYSYVKSASKRYIVLEFDDFDFSDRWE